MDGWSDKTKVILNSTQLKFKLKLKLELSLATTQFKFKFKLKLELSLAIPKINLLKKYMTLHQSSFRSCFLLYWSV